MEREQSALYSMLENAKENGVREINYSGVRFTVDFEKLKSYFPIHKENIKTPLEGSFIIE